MDVSLYLKRPDSKTETSIFARISYYGQRLKFYLSEKILPAYWNKKTQLARETRKFPDYAEFNTRIRNITSDIKTAIRKHMNDNDGQFPSPELLKEVLNQQIKFVGIAKKQDFFGFYETMIEEAGKGLRINHKSGKPMKRDSTKVYTTVLNHLKQYALEKNVKVDFDSIDLDFYNSYTEYLSNICNLSLNTIGNNIKTIKLVLNEATERGLNTNQYCPVKIREQIKREVFKPPFLVGRLELRHNQFTNEQKYFFYRTADLHSTGEIASQGHYY